MNILRTLAAIAATLVVLGADASAQEASPNDYGRAIAAQEATRTTVYGAGAQVRFVAFDRAMAQIFGLTPPRPLVMNAPMTIADGRVSRPDIGFAAPAEFGACRMALTSGLDGGAIGARHGYVCRIDAPLAFVTLSYEIRAHMPIEQVANEITRGEAQTFGLSVPQCTPHQGPRGADVVFWCESSFRHGPQQTPARNVWMIGGVDRDFFFVSSTACAAEQCDGALPAFEQFITSLDFSALRGSNTH